MRGNGQQRHISHPLGRTTGEPVSAGPGGQRMGVAPSPRLVGGPPGHRYRRDKGCKGAPGGCGTYWVPTKHTSPGRRISAVVAAVVFDLDGVLIDSEPVWEQVRRQYVAEHGGQWRPDSQQRLMGMSTPEWSSYLATELGVEAPPARVAREVVDEVGRRYQADIPLMPGAVDAVHRMAARWPLGLASSASRPLIDRVLAATKMTSLFEVTVSTEEVRHGKPAPDVYLTVVERLAVAPAQTVAVEDSSNGLRSASAAGMVVVAVPHPRYPPAPDALARADLVIRSLDDLQPEILERLPARDG